MRVLLHKLRDNFAPHHLHNVVARTNNYRKNKAVIPQNKAKYHPLHHNKYSFMPRGHPKYSYAQTNPRIPKSKIFSVTFYLVLPIGPFMLQFFLIITAVKLTHELNFCTVIC